MRPQIAQTPQLLGRRDFLLSALALFCFSPAMAAGTRSSFNGGQVFDRVVARALTEGWVSLPIGDLMGKIARELEGTPYVGGTLDRSPDKELCTVDLAGLDCVTFFESTLDLARMLKKGGRRPEDLLKQIQFTRYRGGHLDGYTSRLHYTTDWFVDNAKKGVVKILQDLPGAEPYAQKVGFMTEHPEKYPVLAVHKEFIPRMKEIEERINGYELKYVPLDKLPEAESLLQTGDIVGVCTTTAGIDISHTGLIVKDKEGVAHFMDASSKKANMKVTFEPGPISKTLSWSKTITGAMFARPLEPK